jgi:hypothetical protein
MKKQNFWSTLDDVIMEIYQWISLSKVVLLFVTTGLSWSCQIWAEKSEHVL